MFVVLMDGERGLCTTLKEASALSVADHDARGAGASEWYQHAGIGDVVVDGEVVAHVSYNGRVWRGAEEVELR